MKKLRFAHACCALALLLCASCANEAPIVLESPTPTGVSGPATPTPDASISPIPAGSANAGLLDLVDGRHPAYLTSLSISDRRATIDVIQFLTGKEALDAFRRDNPGEADLPNDYYIVNANKQLRSGTLAPEAGVKLVNLAQDSNADLNDATLEELDAYLKTVDRLMVPFWLTVAGGKITAIEEQYLP
ncbi:MAG TPA: hypothetical protein VHI31_01840 [Actinomycetota bacterium]|nr:hypothetical protein [Actinomycetota bacterium]